MLCVGRPSVNQNYPTEWLDKSLVIDDPTVLNTSQQEGLILNGKSAASDDT